MTLTLDELRELPEPYATLRTGEALSEHREQLNQLPLEEMRDLAAKLVLGCPQEELRDFGYAIEAIRQPHSDEKCFHAVLVKAFEVKKRLLSLLDSRNTKPHLLFLGAEFDETLFNEFNSLALHVMEDNEAEIAGKLAKFTPEDKRSELKNNLDRQFPESLITTKVGQAFTIRRDIDNLLLSDRPYQYFLSRDFCVDSDVEFPELFQVIIGKESSIAGKLALNTPAEDRSKIARNVNMLAATGEFSQKIRTAFELRRNIDLLLLSKTPETFFETRRGFNEDACLEFSLLFPALLEDKEQAIGEKLSQITDSKIRSDIALKLERINSTALDQNSPFRKIASAMSTPKPFTNQLEDLLTPQNSPISRPRHQTSGSARNSLFNEQLRANPLIEKPIVPAAKEASCCSKFCGLFC